MTSRQLHRKVLIEGKELDLVRTPCSDLFILQRASGKSAKVSIDQSAKTLLPRLAKALSKPGISRASVFGKGGGRVVYAYSIDPDNPEQLVREDAKGKRTLGRLVNGHFRPVRPGS